MGPYARWCGKGGAAKPPPIPIRWHRAHLQAQAVTNSNTEKPVSAVHLRRLTAAILAVGFASAIIIYLTAGAAPENPLGYEPLATKKYVHDLELYGGKANVLAAEFREWFAGLWYGRNLSYTVAVITVLIVLIIRFLATPLPPAPLGKEGNGGNPPAP